MNKRGISNDERSESRSPSEPKRQKSIHNTCVSTFKHEDYTIAWICALHMEMAAARAMLDEVHRALPRDANDSNSYVLGNIGLHKIVIACLPEGHYGTNNAANVITNMTRSFPSIRAGLMVGIGGGVPSKADMRLGDVVVGTRVMQYDFGKIVGHGELQRTAISRVPHHLLGTAVSALRSKHEQEPSQVLNILEQKLGRNPRYCRPDLPDLLFCATYDHESLATGCDGCDHSKLMPRGRRASNQVMIHYGAIASGNQVMKSGTTRDGVARELDVICFEMEAAGLMDVLPCLPIRGICDYSDSHKNKDWQRYAAATAAAYAKELLGELSVSEVHAKATYFTSPIEASSHGNRQRLLDSLKFDQMNSRRLDIKTAHGKTCQWFLNHPDYQAWLDPEELTKHHGFLWISGKPGTGKSTIMEFAYSSMKRKEARCDRTLVTSFFFNARGEYLEKSVLGMYRSLLFQLLDGYPILQAVLDDPDLVSQSQNGCPPLKTLKNLFYKAILRLGQRLLTCFIDALDECDEQQVVDMVQFFEDLTEESTTKGIMFRVCFSSRHYPYIILRRGIRLTLEDQAGHTQDMAAYIASRLRIEDPVLVKELQPQILGKAAGVFMWVVLVVEILNKSYRRGGLDMKKRLTEVPSGLNDLFRSILGHDKENMAELLLCVLWILYAERPLAPAEFYHAIWSGLTSQGLADPQIPHTGGDCNKFDRCVISLSKGLAEITKSSRPRVQFIHESVRDFLIKDKGLLELWPDVGFDFEGLSHEKLRQCCSSYMDHILVRMSMREEISETKYGRWKKLPEKYPFLQYASYNVLYHANAAAKVVSQASFLSHFSVSNWAMIANVSTQFKCPYNSNTSLFYILAERGFSQLIRTRLQDDSNVHVLGESYRYPLFAALANAKKDAFVALLGLPSKSWNGVDITEGLSFGNYGEQYTMLTPLSWASGHGLVSIIKLLLQSGVLVNEMDVGGRLPLVEASRHGFEAIVKLLIDKGADVNLGQSYGSTPLLKASQHGHEAIVKLLVDKGADINIGDNNGSTPLLKASQQGHETIVKLLVAKGADINIMNKYESTPLPEASRHGYEAIVQFLIEKGANINIGDNNGSTPLLEASRHGYRAIVKLLVDKGADINIGDNNGITPLLEASRNGFEAIVQFLIEKEANLNIGDNNGSTPLFKASQQGHEAIVKLLVVKGADINIMNKYESTPLLEASRHGYGAIVKLLVDKGADINIGDNNGSTPLLKASQQSHKAIVKLLIEKGADINIGDNNGITPLLKASRHGYGAIVKLLVDKGADINIGDNNGITPLLEASQQGHEAIVKLLIEKEANINIGDNNGSTPLLKASQQGHEAIVRLLVVKGADINLRDNGGSTPLLKALQHGHKSITRLLVHNGADITDTPVRPAE